MTETPRIRTHEVDVLSAAQRVLNTLRYRTRADTTKSDNVDGVFTDAQLHALPMMDPKFQQEVLNLLEGKSPNLSRGQLIKSNGNEISITPAGNELCLSGTDEWKDHSHETDRIR